MIAFETKYDSIIPSLIEHKSKVIVAVITFVTLILFGAGLLKILIFLALLAISAGISYWLGSLHSPVDASPAFFIMILVTREYGIIFAIIFGLFGDLMPTIISGDEVDATTLVYFSSFIIVSVISGVFSNLGIVIAGIICTLLLGSIGLLFTAWVGDKEGMFETATHVGCSLLYFILIGNFVFWLLST